MKCTALSLVLLFSVFLGESRAASDTSEYQRLLVGTWREDYSEGELRSVSEKTFHRDGSATGWVKIWRRGPDGKEALVGDVTFKSRWKIEGQILVSYEVSTDPEGMLDPKKEIR